MITFAKPGQKATPPVTLKLEYGAADGSVLVRVNGAYGILSFESDGTIRLLDNESNLTTLGFQCDSNGKVVVK